MNRREFLQASAAVSAGWVAPANLLAQRAPADLAIAPLPPSAELPAILRFRNGTAVTNKAQWLRRRSEILALAEQQMYGAMPPTDGVRFVVSEAKGQAFGGLAVRRQVRILFTGTPAGASASLLLYVPVKLQPGHRRAPVILGLNFSGNHTVVDDPAVEVTSSYVDYGRKADARCVADHHATGNCRGTDAQRWPVEEMLRHGYALATMYRGDIDADLSDSSVPGLRAAFPALQQRQDNFSTVSAWAWALSRALDYISTDNLLDAQRVAVFGWSRLGKAAVWAGATDTRFAAVISNESGAGGAKLFRHGQGEDIARLNRLFPHWFCRSFRAYDGEDRVLPFDQHQVLACVAPRPLYVASAIDDKNSDPEGEFLGTRYASEAWRFLHADGVPSFDSMPAVDTPTSGRVSYHVRTGAHDVTAFDWNQYLRFLDRWL